jgi:hypothetical protein
MDYNMTSDDPRWLNHLNLYDDESNVHPFNRIQPSYIDESDQDPP